MAAFSPSAFSTSAFSPAAFDFGATPEATESKGGIDDYRRYRKYLENLEKAARARDESKYIRTSVEAARELNDLPVDTPEIDKLAEKPDTAGTLALRRIDYDALEADILALRAYLDAVSGYRIKLLEADDEAAFLLLIQ